MFVITSLSRSADIFRACYSISMHMRLRVKGKQMERYSEGEKRRRGNDGEMFEDIEER